MTGLEKADRYQEENRVDKREKPVFHLTPPTGWLNDPNGFSMYQGKIHLFYQYNPYQNVWGNIHWGHCISEDFIKWQELSPALAPDMGYDAGGCFSGSAIETTEGHVLIYTGVMETEEENGLKKVSQHQCMAIGDGLHYDKIKENPIISPDMLPNGCSFKDFRDPKVWKEGDVYYLVAASKNKEGDGQAVLFSSKDLRNWNFQSVLADNRKKYGLMWECPDFFPMAKNHVLIVSPMDMQADGKEFHNGNQSMAMIGNYDRQNCKFKEEQVISLDYGTDFYAPQTMLTEDGRRVLIAWMHSWDMDINPAEMKWNGMMTIPRQLEIKEDALYQSPVKELENYHTEAVIYREEEISGSVEMPGIRGRVLDLTLELLDGDYETFTVTFAKNERYQTSFCYIRTAQVIEFDRTFCGMRRDVVCRRTMKIRNPEKNLKIRNCE